MLHVKHSWLLLLLLPLLLLLLLPCTKHSWHNLGAVRSCTCLSATHQCQDTENN
jgi:hypothetical protein